jgi:phage N-6-adenine-methyltransferase
VFAEAAGEGGAMSAAADMTEDPRQCWRTPRVLFDVFHERCRFDVDAAADDSNHLLPCYWTVRDDGLALLRSFEHRRNRVFVNPPYGHISPWAEACCERTGWGSFSAMLVPARTDQIWFHRYATHGALYFSRGRIQFDPPAGIAPSSNREGSVLVVFDPLTFGRGVVGAFDAHTGELLP